MRVKRYVVHSMPEALHRIKSDLGKNAVILNTKQISVGGFLGMFRQKRIEVIAAIDSSGALTATAVQSPPTESNSSPVSVIEREPIHDERVVHELAEMKRIMQQLIMRKEPVQALPASLQQVTLRLSDQGVSDEIISQWVLHMLDKESDLASWSEDRILAEAKEYLASIMNKHANTPHFSQSGLIHFVGPTGVGKTTTIAKLAADLKLKQKKKVALLTSDTYRIAAVEQLKTYANILNIPLEVIFSPADLKQAVLKLKDYDVILMDTAGRNYQNDLYVSELNNLLSFRERSETVLVLSLTSKYSDMVAIAEQFQKIRVDKVLFTKADETHSYGSIINLTNRFHMELSFLTFGQNVPDDIARIDPKHVASLILGEQKYA